MPELTLDHVVIGVRDLDQATADYALLLGRAPSWYGEHPKYGTRNSLFRLNNTYVELLAAGERSKGQWAGDLSKFLDKTEGIYALALGTDDIDRLVRYLRERELPVQNPSNGDGIDKLGRGHRFWRNARVPAKHTNGAGIFFIQHFSPADALPRAEAGAAGAPVTRLDHVVVLSPDLEQARRLWGDTLGARLALDRTFPERNTRIVFFRLGDITIEISGGAVQTEEGMGKPDRLWGLAWEVEDLAATVARLRASGVEVSDPRRGAKPGTLVATAKSHTHGVATLLIEHTPESFMPQSRLPQGEAYDSDAGRRAFTATGLHHVALAVTDMDEARTTWRQTLGIEANDMIESPAARLAMARLPGGDAMIGLAQALTPQHRIAEWIEERGPGMFAIAVQVDDIVAAVRDLRAKGIAVSDPEYGALPGTRVARIERAHTNGVSVQLVQNLAEVL